MRRAVVMWLWLLSRVLTVLLLGHEGARGVTGDIGYFAASLAHVGTHGLAHTLVEYPLPAVGALAIPWLASAVVGGTGTFGMWLVLAALATDAAFTLLLSRQQDPADPWPVGVWLLAAPVLGALFVARLDLLVGILVAVGLLLVARSPRLAAGVLAVATALKLWPVLLLPALVAATTRRRVAAATLLVVGGGVAAATVLVAGWPRLVSPLGYQSERGLQVESVAATPVMLARLADPSRWQVGYARSKSYEVVGPAVQALLSVSTLLSVLLLAGVAVLSWRALRRGSVLTPEGLVWLALAAVTGFMVVSKVLSPQYLLWLLPMVCVGLLLAPGPALRRWATGLLVVAALTHLVYPIGYSALVFPEDGSPVVVGLLTVRNVLLVLLLGLAAQQAWRTTGERSPVPAVRRA